MHYGLVLFYYIMKKLLLLLIVCVSTSYSFSQRITQMTIEGKPSSVPFAAFNPKTNTTTKGDGQIIFPPGTDLSNVNVTLNTGTAVITEPQPLPTDWTSTVTDIKVVVEASGDYAYYDITAKVIKPGTLPLEIKTGAGYFDSNSWTPETLGWAAAAIDKGQNLIRFGSANRSFMVAFDSAPDSLFYTIKALGTWEGSNSVFDVDGSADGVNWTSIKQYNATDPMPGSSPAVIAKLELNNDSYRFIRWIYTTRNPAIDTNKGFNVSLENILVSKDILSSVNEIYKEQIGAYIAGNELILKDNSLVSELSVYNTAGVLLKTEISPQQSIAFPNIAQGVYIVKMKLHHGTVIADKLIKK